MEALMTASERLTVKLRLAVPQMLREMGRLWQGDSVRVVYLEWLRILHSMVRSTVPLMLAATDACLHRPGDPVAQGFASYLSRHIREEYGHDAWVLEDYEAAGGDPAEILTMTVGGAVAAVVGSQYYWIRHVHPIALLGHIAVLEGYPPAVDIAGRLAARSGLPREAFRSLERHAVLDQRHRDEAYRLIDTLPLQAQHETLIGVSALSTAAGVREVAHGVRIRMAGRGPAGSGPGRVNAPVAGRRA
jgi:hypothetical protein